MTHSIFADVTTSCNFFQSTNPAELIEKFGNPLYVYNEKILRQRCCDVKNLVSYPNFKVNYSAKANSNLELLKVVRSEGIFADAMSPGEIFVNMKAGFTSDEIFFIPNNVSADEMKYAIERKILISVDSVSQLEMYGKLNPESRVAVRFNPGIGAGHHQKVVTGGKNTKFGVDQALIADVKMILSKYNLTLAGINQHIGSLFMESNSYIEGVQSLLAIAKNFTDLEFIDLGGGFGIPYRKQEAQERLDLKDLGEKLSAVMFQFAKEYGKEIQFKIEPGRYISAECGVLLGKVHSVKMNHGKKYVGTDLGFNVLARPVMYDSHHEIEIFRTSEVKSDKKETVSIVGNICESGDIIAKDRELPEIFENDILAVLDAGAYGYAMSSNYNNRLRPAEVLVQQNGSVKLIRRRDTIEDLVQNFI